MGSFTQFQVCHWRTVGGKVPLKKVFLAYIPVVVAKKFCFPSWEFFYFCLIIVLGFSALTYDLYFDVLVYCVTICFDMSTIWPPAKHPILAERNASVTLGNFYRFGPLLRVVSALRFGQIFESLGLFTFGQN